MQDPELLGIIGSLILVIGAAWPLNTTKNIFFAVGNACMFGYALMNYFNGGSIFFILLQVLIAVATVLMFLNTNDVLDATVLGFFGAILTIYGLYLFRDYTTLIFIIGLVTLAVGYALNGNSMWRQAAFVGGSSLIAWFSFLEGNQIFLWLNVFFAGFSLYYVIKLKSS